MRSTARFLNASDAARRLGISPKALRLYEQRGLVAPVRTSAGWRTYGPVELARAGEIAALRALGLSLTQVARVLDGDPLCLDPALAAHQAALEDQARQLALTVIKVRGLRASLGQGQTPATDDIAGVLRPRPATSIAFSLPWPWVGERFELRDIKALTYITGPLGSGKTRLAHAIAAALPDARFLGLERCAQQTPDLSVSLAADPALSIRVNHALAWLIEEGAVASSALLALLALLESDEKGALVIDMIEQDLDEASQEALMTYLRGRGPEARPLVMLTRSRAILDLAAVGRDETIILCPANHSPPSEVMPCPGSPGYEAVATCLASAEVRGRTAGVIAWRPVVA